MSNEGINHDTAVALRECREMTQEVMKILNDLINDNTASIDNNEDAICELSENTETSIADLEQAICDLSEEVGNNG